MFGDWFVPEAAKIGFEDVKYALNAPNKQRCILLNTLPHHEQSCLIQGTLPAYEEESTINRYIDSGEFLEKCIIVYGRHGCDPTIHAKCKQLKRLGFVEVYMYVGGLFEWLLLQDIYGDAEFPTTSKMLDILKYRPNQVITMRGNTKN